MSFDSTTIKKETLSQEQLKANNTIINRKDKVERHQYSARGSATVPLSKDVPLNNNVTQITEKKSNGTLKVLIKLGQGSKESGNGTGKTNAEKTKLSLPKVTFTENDEKPSQDSVAKVPKAGVSVIQKHANATEELKEKDRKQPKGHEKNVFEKHLTTSTEKDKKPIRESVTLFKEGSSEKKTVGKHLNVTTSAEKETKTSKNSVTLLKEESTEKKLMEKHSGVTYSIEKDKKPSQSYFTQPKEGSSDKKMVGKLSHVTTSTEKDRKFSQSNSLPKDGSTEKRKAERFLNTTATDNKDRKFVEDDETTTNKKVTSGNKKGETHVNVTASAERDKKLNQGNVMPLNEASLGKSKGGKHLNVTNFTEKDRRIQSKVTTLTSGMRNVTNSSEKRKMLVPGNETKVLKVELGNKTAQKRVNITSSTGKVTILKDELSGKTKADSHLSVTMSIEKDKNTLQSNQTKVLTDFTTEKKRVEKHFNVTTFTGKDKMLYKSNSTLSKEGSSQKGKVDMNVKMSREKGKKLLQGDETADLAKVSSVTEEKAVNATTTSEKHKSLQHSHKEDASKKNKVNQDFKNITIFKTHAERTTKLIDVGRVEVHNITATGFVITWEAPQGLFRNFTVTRREVRSGRSSEEEAEKSQGDDLFSANKTTSKTNTGKADGKTAETFSQTLTGSARSYRFKNLHPRTKYSVSLISSGPRIRSKVHRLFVSTGK